MGDAIDDNNSIAALMAVPKKRLYTRCSYCGMFYQRDAGTKCPGCGKGVMI